MSMMISFNINQKKKQYNGFKLLLRNYSKLKAFIKNSLINMLSSSFSFKFSIWLNNKTMMTMMTMI